MIVQPAGGAALDVLITGARGFIGKNLAVALKRRGGLRVFEADLETPQTELEGMLDRVDVVFHLAGVNRPDQDEEFFTGNVGSVEKVCQYLQASGRRPLIVLSSSAQADLDNPYGRSKRNAEEVVLRYRRATGAPVVVFRLPGVFGKWCRPNYNSVVATFCHNVSHDLPIEFSDPSNRVRLVHVDDVVQAFARLLDEGNRDGAGDWRTVEPVTEISLRELADLIRSFRLSRSTRAVPQVSTHFERALYSTYLSYLPDNDFAYDLQKHQDTRGELAELLRSPRFGQLFVSRTRPGITRGNHYHDLKVEKFVVIEGEAVIHFRSILGERVIEYPVSGREFRVVDIPPGYTHNITNVGRSDLIVLFWASEPFDHDRPDTYGCEV